MALSRRRFTALGVGALAGIGAAGVAGCSSGDAALRVSFYGDPGQKSAMTKALHLLEQEHSSPALTLQPGSFDGYYDKLATELGAGSAPDLVMNDFTHLAGYAERGALLDLAPYEPDPIDSHLARPTAFQGGRSGSHLYGVPIGTHTQALLVDTDQIDHPTNDLRNLDWGRFAELTTEFGKEHQDKYGTEDAGGLDFAFEVWVRQRGGELFTHDHKLGFSPNDLAAWYDYWDKLRHRGAAVPMSTTEDPTVDPLPAGKAAFGSAFSSYRGPQSQTKHTLTPLPLPATSRHDTPGHYQYLKPTNVYCVPADSKRAHPAVSRAAAFLTDPKVGKALGTLFGSPPSTAVFNELQRSTTGVGKKILDFDAQIQSTTKHTTYPPPRPTGAEQLLTSNSALLKRMNQSIAYKQLTPTEGAKQFFKQAQSYLQS